MASRGRRTQTSEGCRILCVRTQFYAFGGRGQAGPSPGKKSARMVSIRKNPSTMLAEHKHVSVWMELPLWQRFRKGGNGKWDSSKMMSEIFIIDKLSLSSYSTLQ